MRRLAALRLPNRKAFVILAVLIVVVVLSLAAYRFTDGMTSEYVVAARSSEAAQTKAFAASGVHYAMGLLADPNAMSGTLNYNPYDNQSAFAGISLGDPNGKRGGGRFSLIAVGDTYTGAGESRYAVRYGMTDESAKLNLNALMKLDPTGTVLYNALIKLPNMTEDVADAIVDWVDSDDASRSSGAESSYYAGMPTPYRAKNGPLNSIDELLLVRGVTPQLLFGNDRNRNGVLDAGEDDGSELNRGWSEFLTCYGREVNIDSEGLTRIDLNTADLATLSAQLTPVVGQDLSDYIVYVRSTNKAVAAAPLTATQVAAPPANLRDLVQKIVDAKGQGTRKLSSTMTLFSTQIPLTAPPAPPGMPPNPVPVVSCPLNDPAQLQSLLSLLLDKTSASTGYELSPRINVNTAPRDVLLGLPGLIETEVDTMITTRSTLTPTDPATLSGAWIVTQAKLSADKFKVIEKYIGGRTFTYRIHSVGYFGKAGGPVSRAEAVVDVALGVPRILYYRDLTDLGRGFTDDKLPR